MPRLTLVLTLAALAGAAPAAAQDEPSCVGEVEAEGIEQKAGPNLRFGIGPLVQAGQIGPLPGPAVAEQPERTHEALARLRPPTGPFVLRLNRFFWSDGEVAFERYLALARRLRGAVTGSSFRFATARAPSRRETWPPGALTSARWCGVSGASGGSLRCRSPMR